MPVEKSKPRGVVGALSKQVDELRGQVEDQMKQIEALKELTGSLLRDGGVGVGPHHISFNEFMENATIAFIQSAGYQALGKTSIENSMTALVDAYKGVLAFCGAPQNMIDDAEARREAGIERLQAEQNAHLQEVASKGGYGDGTAITNPDDLRERSIAALGGHTEPKVDDTDPSTWGVDKEAEAFLGPAS